MADAVLLPSVPVIKVLVDVATAVVVTVKGAVE